MRIDVAFTPAEAAPAPIAIVVDVLRATSTIAQALAAGYRRVLCTDASSGRTSFDDPAACSPESARA